MIGFFLVPTLALAALMAVWYVSVKLGAGDEEPPSDQPFVGTHAPDTP